MLTAPGIVSGLDVVLEHAIELAVHDNIEVGEEVIGHLGTIEPVVDSEEHLAMLLGHHDMESDLANHAVSPLHLVVWR